MPYAIALVLTLLPALLYAKIALYYPAKGGLAVSPSAIAEVYTKLTGEAVDLHPYDGRSSLGLAYTPALERYRTLLSKGTYRAHVLVDTPESVKSYPELLFAGYLRLQSLPTSAPLTLLAIDKPPRYNWNDGYRDLMPNFYRLACAASITPCPASYAWWQVVKDSRELIKDQDPIPWVHALALAITLEAPLPEKLPAEPSYSVKAPQYAKSVRKALIRANEMAWYKGRPHGVIRLGDTLTPPTQLVAPKGQFEGLLATALTNYVASIGIPLSLTAEKIPSALTIARVDSKVLPPQALTFARPISTNEAPHEALAWLETYLFASYERARAKEGNLLPLQLLYAELLTAQPQGQINTNGLPTVAVQEALASLCFAAATGSCDAGDSLPARQAIRLQRQLALLQAKPNQLLLTRGAGDWNLCLEHRPTHPVELYITTLKDGQTTQQTIDPRDYRKPIVVSPPKDGYLLITTQSKDPAADNLLILRGNPTQP